jgi:hypothetical protein
MLMPCLVVLLGADSPVVENKAAVTASLPDLSAKVKQGQCNRFPTAGADQTYMGEWKIDADGNVTGIEKRVLFANQKWKKTRGRDGSVGKDCEVIWNITGKKIAPTVCEECTYGISYEANVDYDKSTCAQRITVDGNHRRGAYDVKENADGTVQVHFGKTGNLYAQGHHVPGAFNYVSAHRCVWF